MPYASDAQRRYFNANRAELEAQGVDVDEWNQSSKGKKLPEKVKKKTPAEKKAFLSTMRKWLGIGGDDQQQQISPLAAGGAAAAMAGGAAAMQKQPAPAKPAPAWTGPDWAEQQYRNPARFEFIPHQWDMPGGQRSGRLVDKQTGQVVQAHDDVNAQQQWLNQMFNKKAPGNPASTAPPASPPAQPAPASPTQTPKNPAHSSYQSQMQRGLDSGFFANPGAAKAEMEAARKAQGGGGMDKESYGLDYPGGIYERFLESLPTSAHQDPQQAAAFVEELGRQADTLGHKYTFSPHRYNTNPETGEEEEYDATEAARRLREAKDLMGEGLPWFYHERHPDEKWLDKWEEHRAAGADPWHNASGVMGWNKEEEPAPEPPAEKPGILAGLFGGQKAASVSSVARRLVVSKIRDPRGCTKEAAVSVLSRLTADTGPKSGVNSVLDGLNEPPESPHSRYKRARDERAARPESSEPLYYTKVALAAMRRDKLLVGPQRRSWARNRSDRIKEALSQAPQGAAVGPAADAVSMLRGATGPNPMAAMAQNPLMQQGSQVGAPGGATSPAQNPINMYGPLNNADQVGGGMFGQKNTEGGSLKLAGTRLLEKMAAMDPLRMGDLTITDRENLGLDIYNRMTGQKVSFFTQGGELGLMEWLSEKYPKGRQSSNVALGHQLDGTKLKEKLAFLGGMFTRRKPEEKDKRRAGWAPWLAAGVGAGSLGLAHGMASDAEVKRVLDAANAYDPRAFTDPNNFLPKNQTGLTYYQKTLSPGAQLRPFGIPAGDYLTAIRSSKKLMGAEPIFDVEGATEAGGIKGMLAGLIGKDTGAGQFLQRGLNLPSYGLFTPQRQEGLSGRQHYHMFSRGPVAAYMHQMKAKFPDTPVPTEFGVPEGTKYTDWMGRKLEDFVASRAGERINPYEVTTAFMPHEDQVKLMEDFHASLPEDVQSWRIKTENPGPGYATQSSNYLPKAEAVANARNKLKDIGMTAGGAGLGGLAGHGLYRWLTDDDKESWLGGTLSTGAGMGLGGLAGYFGGTQGGRDQMAKWVQQLSQKFGKQSNHIDWAEKLAMQPQAPPPAPAPQGAAPPPPPQQPPQGAASASTGRSMAQINRQLAQSPKQKQQPLPPAPAQPAAA